MLKILLIILASVNAVLAGLLVETRFFVSGEHETDTKQATVLHTEFSAEADITKSMVQHQTTEVLETTHDECNAIIDDAFFALHADDPVLRGFVRSQNIKQQELRDSLTKTPPAQLISVLLKAIDSNLIDINESLSRGDDQTAVHLVLSSIENISVKNIDLFFERGAIVYNTSSWKRVLSSKAPDIIAYMLNMGFAPELEYEIHVSGGKMKLNFATHVLLNGNLETLDYLTSSGYSLSNQIEITERLKDRSTRTVFFTLSEYIQQDESIKNKAELIEYLDTH